MDRRLFLAGAAAAAAPAVALAQAPTPNPPAAAPPGPAQAPGFFRFRLGDLVVTTIHDGFVRRANALEGFVTNAAGADIQRALDDAALPAQGLLNPYVVTFVQTPRGLIAFDAGTGAGQLAPGTGALPAGMAAAGLRPEGVTLICVSHFHGDHITGLTTPDNRPFFPKAELAVPAAEWAWWSDESNAARSPQGQRATFANTARRFGPLRDRMRIFEGEAEVAPGIRAVVAHGHTPGHTAYHFNFPAAGRVTRDGEGFRWHPMDWASQVV